MTTYISQSGTTVTVDFGGAPYPAEAPDQNTKALTVGGLNAPLIQLAVPGTSGSITVPTPTDTLSYDGEPITAYLNGHVLETAVYDETPVVSAIEITAPEDGATITTEGTATAKVLDQFGDEMPTETVSWASGDRSILDMDPSGLYQPQGGTGEVTITATSSTDPTVSATISVTVSDP